MPAAKQAAASRWGWLRLVLCAAGIYGAYLTQGMVQEDLSTRRCAAVAPLRRRPDAHPARPPQVWGSQGAVHARRVPEPRAERGVHVLVRPVAARAACAGRQRAGTALLAGRAEQHGGARVRGAGAQKHQARVRRASPSALFSHRSPFAVRSYTAQVLAKSCKLIPVMFARFVLDGKRYSALEYTAAALIAGTSRPRRAIASAPWHAWLTLVLLRSRHLLVRRHQKLRRCHGEACFTQRARWVRARVSQPGHGRVHECVPGHGACGRRSCEAGLCLTPRRWWSGTQRPRRSS